MIQPPPVTLPPLPPAVSPSAYDNVLQNCGHDDKKFMKELMVPDAGDGSLPEVIVVAKKDTHSYRGLLT